MGKDTSANNRTKRGYHGHPSWSLWNISMWMNSDFNLYKYAVELCRKHGKEGAADILFAEIGGTKTPDGARFTRSAIRHGLRHL